MIDEIRSYCLAKPGVEETFPFDDVTLVFKVGGKMFLMLPLDNPEFVSVKCDPDRAIDLRDAYCDILPAWHMNKRHWNMMRIRGAIPRHLFFELIDHSYSLVVAALPRAIRENILACDL